MDPRIVTSDAGRTDDLDADLARRATAGEVRSFEAIMRRYNQRLFRLAYGVLGDASESEDCLQESYVRAFYSLSKYAGRGSLGAWLAQIVRNEAIDRLRARAAQRKHISLENELDDGESPIEARSTEADPLADTERDEMKRAIEAAITELPDTFREVFMLREVEGLSIEETAEYLAIPAATVRTRDFRARRLLRKRLGERIDRTVPTAFEFMSTRCDRLVARVLARIRN